mmetsp:Transcript_4052/g.6089  ORF Transcript_4052/g.6089 Transcript_4052/m.6089 type:complete len:96 (-) Transcript_4052:1285-1572(-)
MMVPSTVAAREISILSGIAKGQTKDFAMAVVTDGQWAEKKTMALTTAAQKVGWKAANLAARMVAPRAGQMAPKWDAMRADWMAAKKLKATLMERC